MAVYVLWLFSWLNDTPPNNELCSFISYMYGTLLWKLTTCAQAIFQSFIPSREWPGQHDFTGCVVHNYGLEDRLSFPVHIGFCVTIQGFPFTSFSPYIMDITNGRQLLCINTTIHKHSFIYQRYESTHRNCWNHSGKKRQITDSEQLG